MGIETALAIGSFVVGAAGQVASMNAAAANAAAEREAANAELQHVYAENQRQQQEVTRVAEEQVSDRQRQLNQELGTIRALDSGLSFGSRSRLMTETAYVGGQDQARIRRNAFSEIEAIQASSRAGRQRASNRITQANNQASSARTQGMIGIAGAGLQLGADIYTANREKKAQ